MAAPRPGDLQEAAQSPEAKVAQEGIILTESQLAALEKAKQEKEAHGRSRRSTRATGGPGHLLCGHHQGRGRIYQQTFIDTYSRVATAKLYTDKSAITAADLLNDRVVPFFDEQGIRLQRILTDRGTEYCGKPENHAYQLYLAVEDIDHSRTKANHPQTNGICERFHKTLQDECYSLLFRRNSTTTWRNCRWTWTRGWRSTIKRGPIQDATATARRPGDFPADPVFGLGERLEPRR